MINRYTAIKVIASEYEAEERKRVVKILQTMPDEDIAHMLGRKVLRPGYFV